MPMAPMIVQAPYMLDHLTADAQRISASLPPDDWHSEFVVLELKRDINGGGVVLVSGIALLIA
jgi:hypothetical protein